MPLNKSHTKILSEAYTETAAQADAFADKYGDVYEKEADFYRQRAKKYRAYATADKALKLDQAFQEEALFAAEQKEIQHANLKKAKEFFDARQALLEL